MFPMKKVEAINCDERSCPDCGVGCTCLSLFAESLCISGIRKEAVKKIGEHPNLCESNVECKKKGSGSFCDRSTNIDGDYGWCFASKSEAEEFTTKSKFTKDFLKMSVSA
jgi:hypothetical protein